MLTGHLQYTEPSAKRSKRLFFLLGTTDADLRYLDDRQMGLVHYLRPDQIDQLRRFSEQGPDALDGGLTFEQFQERIRPYSGEIKGVLARGKFLAGIGNAYVDEILWEARVSPFRKRRTLSDEELRRIYDAVPAVLRAATEVVRERMPPNIHVKVRDFLQVHRKGGEPCPRCGTTVSEIAPNARITSWCRACQPGGLVKELAMPDFIRVPAPDPFDFGLTVGHQTYYRGRAGSDLFADGVYYRAMWIEGEAVAMAVRPSADGRAVDVSLPNGGPAGALDTAAAEAARLLGFDIGLGGFSTTCSPPTRLCPAPSDACEVCASRARSRSTRPLCRQSPATDIERGRPRDPATRCNDLRRGDRSGRPRRHAFPKTQTIAEAGADALRALKLSGRKASTSSASPSGRSTVNSTTRSSTVWATRRSSRGSARFAASAAGRCSGCSCAPSAESTSCPLATSRFNAIVGELYFDGRRLTEQELDVFATERWAPYRGLATTYLFAHLRQQRADMQ